MMICAQRELDEVFPTVANPTNNTPVYFAAVDGTSRKYPGRVRIQSHNRRPRPATGNIVSKLGSPLKSITIVILVVTG